ncbi:hypothetical protein PAPYR_142 [Paratrimastix pyriformis]|uniref:ARM repeat N-terminal plant domain-containing protein n=1 Tax=Paratrimastix pyriformis TaxID=342808 RepID=A0ABQ8UVK8_9EUKA|nr:hypothetical protein PAPYR_142 [Paratrimastix pyriformis]
MFCQANADPDPFRQTQRLRDQIYAMPTLPPIQLAKALSCCWRVAAEPSNASNLLATGLCSSICQIIATRTGVAATSDDADEKTVPYFSVHILASLFKNGLFLGIPAMVLSRTDVLPVLFELLDGSYTWLERLVALRALVHLSEDPASIPHFARLSNCCRSVTATLLHIFEHIQTEWIRSPGGMPAYHRILMREYSRDENFSVVTLGRTLGYYCQEFAINFFCNLTKTEAGVALLLADGDFVEALPALVQRIYFASSDVMLLEITMRLLNASPALTARLASRLAPVLPSLIRSPRTAWFGATIALAIYHVGLEGGRLLADAGVFMAALEAYQCRLAEVETPSRVLLPLLTRLLECALAGPMAPVQSPSRAPAAKARGKAAHRKRIRQTITPAPPAAPTAASPARSAPAAVPSSPATPASTTSAAAPASQTPRAGSLFAAPSTPSGPCRAHPLGRSTSFASPFLSYPTPTAFASEVTFSSSPAAAAAAATVGAGAGGHPAVGDTFGQVDSTPAGSDGDGAASRACRFPAAALDLPENPFSLSAALAGPSFGNRGLAFGLPVTGSAAPRPPPALGRAASFAAAPASSTTSFPQSAPPAAHTAPAAAAPTPASEARRVAQSPVAEPAADAPVADAPTESDDESEGEEAEEAKDARAAEGPVDRCPCGCGRPMAAAPAAAPTTSSAGRPASEGHIRPPRPARCLLTEEEWGLLAQCRERIRAQAELSPAERQDCAEVAAELQAAGNTAFAASRFSEALQSYTAALENCPDTATTRLLAVLSNMAECYLRLGLPERCVWAATRAAHLYMHRAEPTLTDKVYLRRARAYLALHRPVEAFFDCLCVRTEQARQAAKPLQDQVFLAEDPFLRPWGAPPPAPAPTGVPAPSSGTR